MLLLLLFFFLFCSTINWSLNSTLINDSIIGTQVNTVNLNNILYLTVFGGQKTVSLLYSQQLYVFKAPNFNEFAVFNGGPSPRSHSCSLVVNQTIYFYGGYNGTYLNDLWSFNIDTQNWNLINQSLQQGGRMECGMVRNQNNLIIFGGKTRNGNSTNKHYSINLINFAVQSMNFNSYYTVLQNTLWDGSKQNYTAEGIFENCSSFMDSKNIWLSRVSTSQSQKYVVVVQANEGSSAIYIITTQNLVLNQTIYLQQGIDSCQIVEVGLFCTQFLGNQTTTINFIFFRFSDLRKSQLKSDYIQYSQWPTGKLQSILFNISNDLLVVVVTQNSLKLFRLPQNQCASNNETLSCFYNKAYCTSDYQGAYCNRHICSGSLIFNQPQSFENFTFQCGGNGQCVDEKCVCDFPYVGYSCSNYNRTQCQGEITLMYPLSLCTCQEITIGGNNCEKHFCYNDCSKSGICNQGICQCVFPFSGPDCSILAIDIDFAKVS